MKTPLYVSKRHREICEARKSRWCSRTLGVAIFLSIVTAILAALHHFIFKP